MNIMELLVYIWIIMSIGYIFRPRERRRGYVRVAKGPPGPCPVIPEPRYICENCGMLIETGHGHTREECETYENDPTKPDLTLLRVLKERNRPGRNDPKIRTPYYYKAGEFKNWGTGK